jgi:hypothetical protein
MRKCAQSTQNRTRAEIAQANADLQKSAGSLLSEQGRQSAGSLLNALAGKMPALC